MNSFIIYKTTNLINNKIYVGQHCTSEEDGYLGSGKVIKLAIKKYGRQNFVRETIEFCTSANVDDKEVYWVDKLDATNPEVGYNIAKGGNGGNIVEWTDEMKNKMRNHYLGRKLPKETKIKISLWNQINGNPFKGKQHSKEIKEKWSQERKGTRLGEENSFYGKTHSKKSKQLIGQSSKQRTKYIYFFISPDGQKYDNVTNLQDFCNQFGWKQNNLKFIINEWTIYKGWQIKKVYKEN